MEGAIRVRRLLRPGAAAAGHLVLDDDLGWRTTPRFTSTEDRTDAAGQISRVTVHFDADGFRRIPPPKEPPVSRVLFVGDSFTQALEVSDDETFYAVLAAHDGIEAYALGTGGWGTLQEMMVLDRHIDAIDPDAVVLQFSANDFVNNSFELERRSTMNNNGMTRPYLLPDGRIVRRLPKPLSLLREFSNRHLRSVYFILSRLDRLAASSAATSIEMEIARVGAGHPLFLEASETTAQLLRRMRERVGQERALYAFCVDETPPFSAEFRRIASASNLTVIDGIVDAMDEAGRRGIVTRAADGSHWNAAGHRIAAGVLSRGVGVWRSRRDRHAERLEIH